MPFPHSEFWSKSQSHYIKCIKNIDIDCQREVDTYRFTWYLGINVASSFRLGVLDNLGLAGLESLGLGGRLESLAGLAALNRRGLGGRDIRGLAARDVREEDGGRGWGGRLVRTLAGSSTEGTLIGTPPCSLVVSASCCLARRVLTASRAVCCMVELVIVIRRFVMWSKDYSSWSDYLYHQVFVVREEKDTCESLPWVGEKLADLWSWLPTCWKRPSPLCAQRRRRFTLSCCWVAGCQVADCHRRLSEDPEWCRLQIHLNQSRLVPSGLKKYQAV